MKIQDKDIFHGSALTQIVEHPSFKALNKASEKYGHYLINTDQHIYVKHRSSPEKRKKDTGEHWQFTLQEEEKQIFQEESKQFSRLFLCLVCGSKTICTLSADEIKGIIKLETPGTSWIHIVIPSGGSCHISGTDGKLKKTISHNSFPDKVFSIV